MRIVHLSWEYPPVIYGGLGRHVHALAEAQADAGHEVVVLTQHPGTADLALDEVVNGVRVVRVPQDPPLINLSDLIAWTMAFNHALVRAALRLGRDWRPDVVHGHDWLVAHAGAALKDAFDVPLVVTSHATEAGRHQGWLPSDLSKAIHSIEWWLTYEARRVITCSEHMRWEVTRLFELPSDKVDVIPNGIDLSTWTATPELVAKARHLYAESGGPLVVYTGRLEWEKGVHTLLESVPRLRRRFPQIRIVVVGRGTQSDELKALARRLRLGSSVVFPGWMTTDELVALSSAADVAVVPSIYEPFGLVALEAAAMGTPLVVANTGGLVEFVEHGESGLTFLARDPAALADAVTSVLRDEVLARRLVSTAKRTLDTNYSWLTINEQTIATYVRAIREERILQAGQVTRVPLKMLVRNDNLLRDAT